MIYCDTSLLVSALISTEGASEAAARWLGEQPVGSLAVSDWVHTEFAGAIGMKVRQGALDAGSQGRVLRTWSAFRDALVWLPVERSQFDHAARLLLRPGSRLRSGDALHLAIALDAGCTLATLDERLDEAAEAAGIGIGPILRGH